MLAIDPVTGSATRSSSRGTATCRDAAGLSLVETLIALLVLSAGLAALARTQTWLWQSADLSRQRTDALQLVQAQLESARAFTRLNSEAGQSAWADLVDQAETDISDRSPATVYRLGRRVTTLTAPRMKTLTQEARWTDRAGTSQRLALTTSMAALDPRVAGWLTLAPDAKTYAAPQGRHPSIPLDAKPLGDGRSAFKPLPSLALTWVFDDASGTVTQRCDSAIGLASADLTTATLSACTSLTGFLLSGTVRFATDNASLTARDAERPTSTALDLDLQLALASTGHPTPATECVDNAPSSAATGQTSVRWWCVVRPAGTPPRWSGRADLVPVGWTIATQGAGAYRVCRYSADRDGNGTLDNTEHPSRYSQVSGPLTNQNFLVVQAAAACPTDDPANLTADPPNFADDSTVQHQP
jgi:Tfp pilus assembly protein PilV